MKKTSLLAAVAAAVVLAACGGGGDSCCAVAPGPTEQVPPSASENTSGFIAYLQALIASSADMLEPVDTSSVLPPKDDMSEPTTVE